ncbi:hypothetical protein GAY31_22715 [Azospirillum brasilense]|nr:hypothetical protein [Azospirillum brasilense]
MPFTIFYSWQSYTPAKANRSFIENALKGAVKSIRDDEEVNIEIRDEMINVDSGVKGTPGMAPITETILRKIIRANVFVVDLTFVATTSEGKGLPNPNVLFELGWAMRVLGHSRIVAVMNTAFGEPTETAYPFDLRHYNFPIQYNLPYDATPEIRKATKSTLVNNLAKSISEILQSDHINPELEDASEEGKRQQDISALNWVFEMLPIQNFDNFVRYGNNGHLYSEGCSDFDVFNEITRSTRFHFFDKELERQFSELYRAWRDALTHSIHFEDTPNINIRRLPSVREAGSWKKKTEIQEQFAKGIAAAEKAWRSLVTYVRQKYPEVDIDSAGRKTIQADNARRARLFGDNDET